MSIIKAVREQACAPAIGWGVLAGTASVISFSSFVTQLIFAILAIGVVGMAHGASDLAMVESRQRPAFLGWYVAAALICFLWWVIEPALALPGFMIMSAYHFGVEDAKDCQIWERGARGLSLVATPATLHAAGLIGLFNLAGVHAEAVPYAVAALALFGGIAAAWLMLIALHRRDSRLLLGTLALLLFPPLVGFSVGFLVLHAIPQTIIRRERIGCQTTWGYLCKTGPVLITAIVLAGVVGALLLRLGHSGVQALFAGIAALAVPHLLVTPWFESNHAAKQQA